jgi:ribulose-5-phosphate 4-epimerase/fuculose-1-phosphate aldolase
MILRNHGLLVCGRSVGEAFELLHGLEHACDAQIAAQAGGGELILPAADVCAHTADQFWGAPSPEARFGGRAWPAMRRMIDRHNPGYAV